MRPKMNTRKKYLCLVWECKLVFKKSMIQRAMLVEKEGYPGEALREFYFMTSVLWLVITNMLTFQ